MEEHLRQQQGSSWGEELKGSLRVYVGAKEDSWLMKQGRCLKQQVLSQLQNTHFIYLNDRKYAGYYLYSNSLASQD